VDVARFFLEFVQDESCGKCAPCRVGTKRMLEILTRITHGEGRPEDIEELERLGNMIKKTSLCGLGQTAPNPVLSTIRHFREEYEQHIHENYCAAGVCPGLCTFVIDEEACKACQRCLKECPADAIVGEPKVKHRIDQDKCIQCGRCREVCPFEAVNVLPAGALAEAQPA
jgi:NADP-reducing hydrogenase subunit HndC